MGSVTSIGTQSKKIRVNRVWQRYKLKIIFGLLAIFVGYTTYDIYTKSQIMSTVPNKLNEIISGQRNFYNAMNENVDTSEAELRK